MASWIKLKSGAWGVRVSGKAAAGQSVTATNKAGKASTVVVSRVVWSGGGVSLCAIEDREPAPARSYGGGSLRGKWTGCACGSIEGRPRESDCFTCRHDE